jgi:hypothetical protein
MDLKPLEEFGYAESVVPIGAALHRRLRIASKVYRYKIRAIVEAGIKLRLDELEQETFYKSQGGSSL